MTGPEHYRTAVEHLGFASNDEVGSDSERYNLATAQVHATLALVAASVLAASDPKPRPTVNAWYRALGVRED